MSNTGFYGKNRKRPAPAQKNFVTENAAAAEENTAPENLVVGRNAVREVLRAGRDIEKLMVAKGDTSGSMRELVALAKEKNVIVQRWTDVSSTSWRRTIRASRRSSPCISMRR